MSTTLEVKCPTRRDCIHGASCLHRGRCIDPEPTFKVGVLVEVREQHAHPERTGVIIGRYARTDEQRVTWECAWIRWDNTNVVTGVPLIMLTVRSVEAGA